MSQTTRYVLFVIISIAIMWAFAPKQTPRPAPGSNTPVSTSPSTPTPAPTGATPPVAGTPPELKAAEPDTAAGPSVQIEGGQWTAIVSLRGAGLESFVLKGAKQSQRTQTAGEPGAGMNLAHAGFGQPLPLAVDLSSLPPAGSFGPNAVYEAQPAQPGQNERTFTRTRNGITVTKRLSWKPDTYQLRLDVSVTGAPAGTYPMRVLYAVNEPPVPPAGMFSTGPRPEAHATVCLIEGDRSITSRAFTSNKPLETLHGHPVFTGIDEKYFIAAMSPGADAAPSTCQIGSGTGAGENTAVLERTLTVAANAPTTSSVDLYIGPKDTKSLAAADHSLTRSTSGTSAS
jgi:YidC/Oxa1 family membrane protein insertase